MAEDKSEIHLTKEEAERYLKIYFREHRCQYWQIKSACCLEGMNYWAFNIEVSPLFGGFYSKLNGLYGFHVYDDGTVKMIAHYPDEVVVR